MNDQAQRGVANWNLVLERIQSRSLLGLVLFNLFFSGLEEVMESTLSECRLHQTGAEVKKDSTVKSSGIMQRDLDRL